MKCKELESVDTAAIQIGQEYTLTALCELLNLHNIRTCSRAYVEKRLNEKIKFTVFIHPNKKPKYTYRVDGINKHKVLYSFSNNSVYRDEAASLLCLYLREMTDTYNEDSVLLTFNDIGHITNILPDKFLKDIRCVTSGKQIYANIDELYVSNILKNIDYTFEDLRQFYTISYFTLTPIIGGVIKSMDCLGLYDKYDTLFTYSNSDSGYSIKTELPKEYCEYYQKLKRQILTDYGKGQFAVNFTKVYSSLYMQMIKLRFKEKFKFNKNFYNGYKMSVHKTRLYECMDQLHIDDKQKTTWRKTISLNMKKVLMKKLNDCFKKNRTVVGDSEGMSVSSDFLSICKALLDFYFNEN